MSDDTDTNADTIKSDGMADTSTTPVRGRGRGRAGRGVSSRGIKRFPTPSISEEKPLDVFEFQESDEETGSKEKETPAKQGAAESPDKEKVESDTETSPRSFLGRSRAKMAKTGVSLLQTSPKAMPMTTTTVTPLTISTVQSSPTTPFLLFHRQCL